MKEQKSVFLRDHESNDVLQSINKNVNKNKYNLCKVPCFYIYSILGKV